MRLRNERKDRNLFRDFLLAVILAAAIHLVIFSIFSVKEKEGTKSASEMKKVVFLPLDAMPDSPVKRNFLYWLDYGDPTLVSKPNQRHGFSSVYAVSGLRTPEPDIMFSVSEVSGDSKLKSFEEIDVGREDPAQEVARSWDYRPPSIPPPVNGIRKAAPAEYPVWRDGDGRSLPQFFSKTEDILKKAASLNPAKTTVLKVSFYGKDFFPRAKIAASCGNQELDAAAVEAFIAKNALLPEENRKTDEPCYIEIEWQRQKGKSK